MLRTTLLTALTATLLIADVPVLKTGQTIIYKKGDDGSYSKITGKAHSYIRNNTNGIVTDNATKLQWQDNTSSQKKNWLSAKEYCATLNLNGGNWRLPTVYELKSIVDYSQNNPPINKTAFKYLKAVPYWSSTAFAGDSTLAWSVNFFKDGIGSASQRTNKHIRVKCVRNQ